LADLTERAKPGRDDLAGAAFSIASDFDEAQTASLNSLRDKARVYSGLIVVTPELRRQLSEVRAKLGPVSLFTLLQTFRICGRQLLTRSTFRDTLAIRPTQQVHRHLSRFLNLVSMLADRLYTIRGDPFARQLPFEMFRFVIAPYLIRQDMSALSLAVRHGVS